MKSIITVLVLMMVSLVSASAETVISNQFHSRSVASWFYDNSTMALVKEGSLMILCDTSGDGFVGQNGLVAASNLKVGEYLGDTDDVILGWGEIKGGRGSVFDSPVELDQKGLEFKKKVGLLFFSNVKTTDTCLLGNEAYGFYRPTTGSEVNTWCVYGASTYYSYDVGGTTFKLGTPVPEPATCAALVGCIVFSMAFIRRNLNRG